MYFGERDLPVQLNSLVVEEQWQQSIPLEMKRPAL